MKTRVALSLVALALVLSACASAEPAPTAARIATLTFLPPTETLLPTATATATPVPSGPCDNPLVPLATGNAWTYRVAGQKETYLYDLTVGNREDVGNININVEMFDRAHDRDIQELIICDNGAIDNFPLYLMSMLLSDYLDGILNTYKQSGQYAPAYPAFVQDNWTLTWQPEYLIEESVNIKDPAGGLTLSLLRSSPIDLSFKTGGRFETITVPGGTFPQALVVSNDFTTQATIASDVIATSGELVIRTTQWYVPYLGLVRAQVDSASVSIMAGQETTIPIQSVLELIEFKPGQ